MCSGNPLYQQHVETEYAVSHVLHLLGTGVMLGLCALRHG